MLNISLSITACLRYSRNIVKQQHQYLKEKFKLEREKAITMKIKENYYFVKKGKKKTGNHSMHKMMSKMHHKGTQLLQPNDEPVKHQNLEFFTKS